MVQEKQEFYWDYVARMNEEAIKYIGKDTKLLNHRVALTNPREIIAVLMTALTLPLHKIDEDKDV